MLRKSTIAVLSILVAVATAHPYNAEWNNARYRWNDLFAARGQEVGARVRGQARAADVEKTSCATVTETRPNGNSYKVRICAADSEGMSLSARSLLVCKKKERKKYYISVVWGAILATTFLIRPLRTPSERGGGWPTLSPMSLRAAKSCHHINYNIICMHIMFCR